MHNVQLYMAVLACKYLKHSFFYKTSIFFAIFIVLCSPALLFAHRVNVFAWQENDKIKTECNYGKNKPAINADVTVLDSTNGKILLNGKTDETGLYIFSIPSSVGEGRGIIIDVNAGEGHKSQWKMEASEFVPAVSAPSGMENVKKGDNTQRKNIFEKTENVPAVSNIGALNEMKGKDIWQDNISELQNTMRNILREEIGLQLASIRQELARQKDPGIVEIIGGIGWITGLAGIAFYFKVREKKL